MFVIMERLYAHPVDTLDFMQNATFAP